MEPASPQGVFTESARSGTNISKIEHIRAGEFGCTPGSRGCNRIRSVLRLDGGGIAGIREQVVEDGVQVGHLHCRSGVAFWRNDELNFDYKY